MDRTKGGYPIRIELPVNADDAYKQRMLEKHGPYLDVYRVKDEHGVIVERRGKGIGNV